MPTSVFARLGIPQDIVDRYLERLGGRAWIARRQTCRAFRIWNALAIGRAFRGGALARRRFPAIGSVRQRASGRRRACFGISCDNAIRWMRFAPEALCSSRCWPDATRTVACRKSSRRRHGAASGRRSRSPSLAAILPTSITTSATTALGLPPRDHAMRDSTSASMAAIDRRKQRSWYVDEVGAARWATCAPAWIASALSLVRLRHAVRGPGGGGHPVRHVDGIPGSDRSARRFFVTLTSHSASPENRPYDVVEISLFFMDVTLRGYMSLRPAKAARDVIESGLTDLRRKARRRVGGVAPDRFRRRTRSGLRPVVLGTRRAGPGDGRMATDGRTINDFWRERARNYASFSGHADYAATQMK